LTEIPEHLLKRSKAAKGKSGDDGGDSGGDAGSSAPVAAASSSPTPAAAATPAVDLPNLDPEPEPPKPVPHFVAAAMGRKKIPVWVLPVIAALPVWAWSFAGTMQQPETEDELLIQAEEAYGTCATCHGAAGGGGVGYALSDGEVLATFPEVIDQLAHVARGSAAIIGQEYGAVRPDGARRVAGDLGVMPAQLSSLTQLELELAVYHERAILSGEDTSSPGYQEWIAHMRELIELGDEHEIDLDLILACSAPGTTPGEGVGVGAPEGEVCPGPHSGDVAEEAAAG
jgi:mono/diheme cytochrome c family protein